MDVMVRTKVPVTRRSADAGEESRMHRRPIRSIAVKKLAPELRKPKPSFTAQNSYVGRFLLRLKEDSQFLRSMVQLGFAALCIWIGVEFVLFVRWGASGGALTYVERPPGVEGFLPISALISAAYWIHTGVVNHIHPSGLFILAAIILMSFIVKKGFCSWLCPIGTLSESLWMLGQRLFKRNLTVPRWLDYPLRSIKYLLLGFFAYSIFRMSSDELGAFIYSPYNKMADVKLYEFFADMSQFAFITLSVLIILSVVIKNFWCRFLCPYGALLGIVGWLSPLKITRTKSTCIDCELCTRVCPANIKVHTASRVWSDECMSCMACVQICPVKDTLEIRGAKRSRRIPSWVIGTLLVGAFVAVTGAAMITSQWQNSIDKTEYLNRFKKVDSPLYQHFRGHVPAYGPTD